MLEKNLERVKEKQKRRCLQSITTEAFKSTKNLFTFYTTTCFGVWEKRRPLVAS